MGGLLPAERVGTGRSLCPWTVPGRPPRGQCPGCGSRLVASIGNTSWVTIFENNRSESALGTAVSWRVCPGAQPMAGGPHASPRVRDIVTAGGCLSHTRNRHHPFTPSPPAGAHHLPVPPRARLVKASQVFLLRFHSLSWGIRDSTTHGHGLGRMGSPPGHPTTCKKGKVPRVQVGSEDGPGRQWAFCRVTGVVGDHGDRQGHPAHGLGPSQGGARVGAARGASMGTCHQEAHGSARPHL